MIRRDQLNAFGARSHRGRSGRLFPICSALITFAVISQLLTPNLFAQFIADYQTNLISGVVSNWSGTYSVSHSGTFLRIDSGGILSDADAYIDWTYLGRHLPGHSNAALVTDPGSVWSNQHDCNIGSSSSGNSLIVSNGGRVVAMFDCLIGGGDAPFGAGSNNIVIITGSGSTLNVSNEMTVGQSGGSSNTMMISGGGQVIDRWSWIGDSGGSNNYVLVTGLGSLWAVTNLNVGYPSLLSVGNLLTIQDSSTVLASNVTVFCNNSIRLNQGSLIGYNGLVLYSNATVSGCGTLSGPVTISTGATVLADCSGNLILMNKVTNNGRMRAINGSVLECYGTVINNGTIDLINGSTNFHGAFINNGVVLDSNSVKISSISANDQDVIIQIPSVSGHSYQLQTATQLLPENWTNMNAPQAGIDNVLSLTDPGALTNDPARFYRVWVTAP